MGVVLIGKENIISLQFHILGDKLLTYLLSPSFNIVVVGLIVKERTKKYTFGSGSNCC